jgi:integrase
MHKEWDAVREQRVPTAGAAAVTRRTSLTPDDLRKYAREYYDWAIECDLRHRREGIRKGHVAIMATLEDAIPGKVTTSRQQTIDCLRDGDHCLPVAHYVDLICEREGIPKHRRSPLLEPENHHSLYREVAQALLQAHLEVLDRVEERDAGRFDGVPRDLLLAAPLAAPPATGVASIKRDDTAGETLSTRAEQYIQERNGTLSQEWIGSLRAIIDLFLEFSTPGILTRNVTKRIATDWKTALYRYPSRGKIHYPGMGFKAILERNATDHKPALATATLNKYITTMSTLFDWIVQHEHDGVDKNPFSGLRIDHKASGSTRDPFTTAQLSTLFHSPLFSGCKSDHTMGLSVPGTCQIRDWRYWLPLLALFTGARLGELAQLHIDDVQSRDNISFIGINETGGKKRLKTASAKRIVPVHPTLNELGFLDFVGSAKSRGGSRLFPEIKADSLGRITSDPSKFFARYMTKVGIKDGPRLVTHSFRHSFMDALRLAGYNDNAIGPLVGHGSTGAAVTAGYGNQPSFPVKDRYTMVKAVRYDGLDLSHLLPAPTIAP